MRKKREENGTRKERTSNGSERLDQLIIDDFTEAVHNGDTSSHILVTGSNKSETNSDIVRQGGENLRAGAESGRSR
jgi:hypothetical protein